MPKEDTQFQPGVSGNPNGRPKKEYTLTELLKEALEAPSDQKGKTKKQMVIDRVYDLAINGNDGNMLKYLFDRLEGKPMQQIQAKIDQDLNITFDNQDSDL